MNISLTNKNALVCGGSKGIGRATAHELANLGANVHVLARSKDELERVVNELSQQNNQSHGYIVADLSDSQSLEEVINEVASRIKFHIWVNNTGGPKAGPIYQAGAQEFIDGFKLHIVSSQIMAKHLVRGMKEDGYGRIINIISTSVKEPIAGLGVSNTIRGAMGNWSKTLASELAQYGITVNNVLPGFTATSRLDAIISGRMKSMNLSQMETENLMKSIVPMRRFADPSELAQVVAFLASPAASYVTGINLPVDGGRTKSL